MTPARVKCLKYLVDADLSMPRAKAAAAKDGFRANTSVWIGAMGEVLALLHTEDAKR